MLQADFVKMVPGLERKITERYLTMNHHALLNEQRKHSAQEVPLLKGSFGHTSSTPGMVANDSSEESLYGMDRAMAMSESINSVIGLTRSTNSSVQGGYNVDTPQDSAMMASTHLSMSHSHSIPVTAEIEVSGCPPPPVIPDSGTGIGPVVAINTASIPPPGIPVPVSREELSTSFQSSSGDHHVVVDVFNRPHPSGIRTLPRLDPRRQPIVNGHTLEDAYRHQMLERSLDHPSPTPTPPPPPNRTVQIHGLSNRKVVNGNGVQKNHPLSDDNGSISSSSSPHTDSSQRDNSTSQRISTAAAMATMPRGPSSVTNGGRKKKSVTIGTFTTVETFDPATYTSAV